MYLNACEHESVVQGEQKTVLELMVRNHPGVMAHICSLFSRRSYNLEGIAVLPVGKGELSRVWLAVVEERKLEQIVKQLEKLHDVKKVQRHGCSHPVFAGMLPFFTQ